MSATDGWNPRFVFFAREQGLAPKEWIGKNRDEEGIVNMVPFTVWISERWAEYRRHLETLPREQRRRFDATDGEVFDAWLAERAAQKAVS